MDDREKNRVDLSRLKLQPIRDRINKVFIKDFLPGIPDGGGLLDMFPDFLAGKDFKTLVFDSARARKNNKPLIFTMGAHVIKVGLSRVIIELMRRGIVTALALNGAGVIHDAEIAMIGETSEDVSASLADGTFAMAKETGEFINGAVNRGAKNGLGMGEAVGQALLESDFPHKDASIAAQAVKLGVPVTVHISIGTDLTQIHPSFDPEAAGLATHRDFRLFARLLQDLSNGGVIINWGSAVILPVVMEKAIAVNNNLGWPVEKFTGANMDFMQHYRANLNPVKRALETGGRGIAITGHHEILMPLFARAVVQALEPGDDSHA